MRFLHTLIIMFVASFTVHYLVMNTLMVDSTADLTNNLGKAYISVIMAFVMSVGDTLMHDHQYSVFSLRTYAVIFAFLALFIYMYRKQIGVNDKQYLEGMIEHHSMALHASKRILEKTNNYNVAKLAKNILQKQNDEIIEMRSVLQSMDKTRS